MTANVAPDVCGAPDALVRGRAQRDDGSVKTFRALASVISRPRLRSTPLSLGASLLGADEGVRPSTSQAENR